MIPIKGIKNQNLPKALSFTKLQYDFTSDELELIMHSRKTLLFWQDSTWIKKEGDEVLTYQWGVLMAWKYAN